MEWSGIRITINWSNTSIMVTGGTSFCWQQQQELQGPVQKRLFPDKPRERKTAQYRFTSTGNSCLTLGPAATNNGTSTDSHWQEQAPWCNILFISVSHCLMQYARPDFFCAPTLFSFQYMLVQHGIQLKSQQSYCYKLSIAPLLLCTTLQVHPSPRASLFPERLLFWGCPPPTPHQPFSSACTEKTLYCSYLSILGGSSHEGLQ